jgi:putative proteasome-type protease
VTFCIGVKVDAGLVGLADTQVVRGDEVSSKAKLSRHRHGERELFVMTSGLRSVRDKVVLRWEDELAARPQPHRRLHALVSNFGDHVRSVRAEDGPSLGESHLHFNSHTIIGGQLADDPEPSLFLVYPEGNWVVATDDAPYFIIGRTSYGKPILDRLLTAKAPLQEAVALAYLAFDSTRASVVDVDFPIDVVLHVGAERDLRHQRFQAGELEHAHASWSRALAAALDEFPIDWATALLDPGPTP